MSKEIDPTLREEFEKNSKVMETYLDFAKACESQIQILRAELLPELSLSEFQQRCFMTYAIGLDQLYEKSKNLSWDIPNNANLEIGDFGLLPGDTAIEEWAIPTTSGMLLRSIVESYKPKTILEMGMSLGYSTAWLASAVESNKNQGQVHTTEIFEPKIKIAKYNFQKLGVNEIIKIHGNIPDLLESWGSDKLIDFVFMDADKQNYLSNFQKLLPSLSKNAIIVVDNVGDYPQFMQDFLLYIDRKCNAGTLSKKFLDIDHGLLVIRKN